jgi:hypothetical protein
LAINWLIKADDLVMPELVAAEYLLVILAAV